MVDMKKYKEGEKRKHEANNFESIMDEKPSAKRDAEEWISATSQNVSAEFFFEFIITIEMNKNIYPFCFCNGVEEERILAKGKDFRVLVFL